jgi:hypothetical protein
MMRAEASINERKLLGFRIEHANVAAGPFDRKELRRRMV